MKKFVCLFISCLTLTVLVSFNVTAQDDYFPGRIHFKIWDTSAIDLPPYDSNFSGTYPYLNSLISDYSIQRIFRPFWDMSSPKLLKIYEVLFNDTIRIDSLIIELQSNNFIEYAEKIPKFKFFGQPNDIYYQNQWYLKLLNATGAWQITTGNSSIKIAIIDNAINTSHQDLSSKIVGGWDVADNDNNPNPPTNFTNKGWSHGTHCAGVAAAKTNNGLGVSSLGYNVSLMPIKTTKNSTNTPMASDSLWQGIKYAINNNADIISMSVGSELDSTAFSQTYQYLFDEAYSKGIVCIAAAGNKGYNKQGANKVYPASYNHVISVGATDQNDLKWSKSNYGNYSNVDIMAPGVAIFSTTAETNSSYASYGGTSQACAIVAGLVSLIKAYNSSININQVKRCLLKSADNIDLRNPEFSGELGFGRINPVKAILCDTNRYSSDFNTTNYIQHACVSDSVHLVAHYYPNVHYYWNFGDGTTNISTSNTNSVSYKYVSRGIYDVKLILKDTITNIFIDSTERKDFLMITECYVQPTTKNHWFFGEKAGLKFETGKAERITNENNMNVFRPSVVRSDSSGLLQLVGFYYGDSMSIMLRSNFLKPIYDGNPVPDLNVYADPGLILPHPNDSNILYFFTTNEPSFFGNPTGRQFRYSVIDLSTFRIVGNDTFYGEVQIANIGINGPVGATYDTLLGGTILNPAVAVGPGITSIEACNGGIWVIVHGNATDNTPYCNQFYVYKFDSGYIRFDHADYSGAFNGEWVIKSSPDGTKLAMINNNLDSLGNIFANPVVYDFDKANGHITFRDSLAYGQYGISFSPNSKLLYTYDNDGDFDYIYQYNLQDSNPKLTVQKIFAGNNYIYSMQLGPDSVLYLNDYNSKYLKGIFFPDELITPLKPNACGYAPKAVILVDSFNQDINAGTFLPTFPDAEPVSKIPFDFTYKVFGCDSIELSTAYCDFDHWTINGIRKDNNPETINISIPSTLYVEMHTLTNSIAKQISLDTLPNFDIRPEINNCQSVVYDKFTIETNYNTDNYNFIWTVNNGTILADYGTMILVDWDSLMTSCEIILEAEDKLTGCTKTIPFEFTYNFIYANGFTFNKFTAPNAFPAMVFPPYAVEPTYIFGGSIVLQDSAILNISNRKILVKRCCEIIVQEDAKLIMDNAELYCCSSWHGITVNGLPQYGQLQLDMDSSSINNAIVAVYAQDSAFINVKHSFFKDNYSHIVLTKGTMMTDNRIDANFFTGYFDNNKYFCTNYSRSYSIPYRKVVFLDSVSFKSIDSNVFDFPNLYSENFDAITINKLLLGNPNFSISANKFISYIDTVIDIRNIPQPAGNILLDSNNFLSTGNISVITHNASDIIIDRCFFNGISKISEVKVLNGDFSNIQYCVFDNKNYLIDTNTAIYYTNTFGNIDNNEIKKYINGIEYYNNEAEQTTITHNLIQANKYGLVVAEEENPLTYRNPFSGVIINLEISCNKFYDNEVGILGSGELIEQGNPGNDAANDFNNNTNWNMLWQNNVNIQYFFYDFYRSRTNPAYGNGTSYWMNGVNKSTTDIDTIMTSPGFSCFGTWIPNFFPVSSESINDETIGIFVYPNPATDELNVKVVGTDNQSIIKVFLYDILGNEINHYEMQGNTYSLNIKGLEKGVYLLRIKSNENEYKLIKFMKF